MEREPTFREMLRRAEARREFVGIETRAAAVIRTHIGLQYDHASMNVARLHFGLPALSPL